MLSWLLLGLLSWAIIKPVEEVYIWDYRNQIAIVKCSPWNGRRWVAYPWRNLIMICDDLSPEIFEAVLYHELWHVYASCYYKEYITWENWRVEWFANAFSYLFTRTDLWHPIYPKILKNVMLDLDEIDIKNVIKNRYVLRSMLSKPILVGWSMTY